MPMTPAAKASVLNGFIGKSSAGPILANCYIGLSTTTPNADGSNFTEPSGGDYARAIIGLSLQPATQVMGVPVDGYVENTAIIFFPEATASWGTLTHFGLFAGSSGGSPLIFGALTSPIAVSSGYVALFRVGNFSMSLT